jgi:ribose transport system substrate-binding protein
VAAGGGVGVGDEGVDGVAVALGVAGRQRRVAGGFGAEVGWGGLYRGTFLYDPSMAADGVALGRLLAKAQGLFAPTAPIIPNVIVLQAQGVFQENGDHFMKQAF